ncbi:MAG: hypothetical protein LBP78_03330 [Acidaminococcales bacterium]|nr:hypothetical protein [Acidaminococcales bacterium]
MPVEEDYTKQPESATTILSETKRLLDELSAHVSIQLEKHPAGKPFSDSIAEQEEMFYRTDMWPLLSKIKAAANDNYSLYKEASEIHAEAMFCLGELYMRTEGFGRAVGIYSTAFSLTDGRSVVAMKCSKALEAARLAYEQANIKKKAADAPPTPEVKHAHSFFDIIKWVFLGFFFVLFCIWGAVLLLDVFFEH